MEISYLDEICKTLKSGEVNHDPMLNDSSGLYHYSGTFKRALNAIANEAGGHFLNHDQITAI